MNAFQEAAEKTLRVIQAIAALMVVSALPACGDFEKSAEDGEGDVTTVTVTVEDGDTGESSTDDGDTAEETDSSDLDNDDIADTDDQIVPNGDYLYVDQGLAASLSNTYLVGYGLGGSDGEYDWCSENLPIEKYDEQGDWPESLQSGKVRFFFPDAVEIFFGNLRTFESGACDTSTDGGFDEWGNLTALNGVDEAICPNPLDGNRLGLYLMKDEDGVFAPGCQGFALPTDDTRDTDNDGTADSDDTSDDTAGTTDVDGDGFISDEDGGDDCDDGYRYTYPGALEYNDDEDNDCDGTVDDGCASGTATNALCG